MKTTDASGNVVNDYTYDVHGKTTARSGSQANDVQFAGQQTDPTGLQYLRARYYDPETGSFLSRDPMASSPPWRQSPTAYSAGDPVNLDDPSGLYWGESKVQKAAKAAKAAGSAAGAAASTASGAVVSQVNALVPPYDPNKLLTAVQLLDLVPLAPICGLVGAAIAGPAGAVAAYDGCAVVEQGIGVLATAAAAAQLGMSQCGASDSAAYLGLVGLNTMQDFWNWNPVAKFRAEGSEYTAQNAVLSHCGTAIAHSSHGEKG